ncbi:MAG: ABC transporter permease [Patescibacteria group bacterium]
MNNIYLIASREIEFRVKSAGFWLATIALPLVVAIFAIAPSIIGYISTNQDKQRILVVNNSGLTESIQSSDQTEFVYSEQTIDQAKQDFQARQYDGILHLPKNLDNDQAESIALYTTNNNFQINTGYIERELSRVLRKNTASELNLNESELAKLDQQIKLTEKNLSDGQKTSNNSGIGLALGFLLGGVMFAIIFIFGSMIMNGIIEEKSNRIAEILISSVKVTDLMFGKILGLAGVVFIQVALWIGIFVVLLGVSAIFLTTSNEFPDLNEAQSSETYIQVSSSITDLNIGLIIFLSAIYFILGYLLYSSWFAALGSTAENAQEASNSGLSWFISLPLSLSMLFLSIVINDPESPISIFLSLFPFTSPVIMLARVPLGVSWWEIVLSILLLVVGVVISAWIAAKIYRVSILAYGKKVTLPEIWKWIRY